MLAAVVTACGGGGSGVRLEGEAARLLDAEENVDLAIFYGSELLGSIDGCGCMGSPRLGGMPYRQAYVEGFRARYPQIATLRLDAGRSMGEFVDAEGRELPDLALENEYVVDALGRFGFDAANLTAHDAKYLERYFTTGSAETAAGARPILGRFVSANLVPARDGLAAPPPFVLAELAPYSGEGPRRVAIAGVTEPIPGEATPGGFRVVDPAEALSKVLPAARAAADLVVVLAYMPRDRGEALAGSLGGLADVVVVANSLGEPPEARLSEDMIVAYSWYKTQMLGELRMKGSGSKIVKAVNRYVKMEEPLPRDPAAAALVDEAKAAVRAAREKRFAESAPGS